MRDALGKGTDCRALPIQSPQASQTLVRRIVPIQRLLVYGLQLVVDEPIQVSVEHLRGVGFAGQRQAQGGMTRTTFSRIVLATLNARYIHASLGLRYLLANLDRHGGTGLRALTEMREYTISRAAPEVIHLLKSTRPDLELPYGEYSADDLAHRVVYVEASRGCPFKCEFCLSALDKTGWDFELDRVLAALDALYQRGARTFKFVDRTFNLKIAHSVRILQFFLDVLASEARQSTHPGVIDCRVADAPRRDEPTQSSGAGLFLHFEVIPDHLPDRLRAMLAQFPPGVLQLEVGVQTFTEIVHQAHLRCCLGVSGAFAVIFAPLCRL